MSTAPIQPQNKTQTTHHIVWLDSSVIQTPVRSPNFLHSWTNFPLTSHSDTQLIIERLRHATIVITNRVPISAEVLDACPHVRLVAVAATGYDSVDVKACRERGVDLVNVRDWTICLPEHIFALILSLTRQLPTYSAAIAAGAWQRHPHPLMLIPPIPRTLSGSTLGFIGNGALARHVAALARAFNMRVIIAERRGVVNGTMREGRRPFEEVLTQADVLVVLCPLLPETRNMIGTPELASMKPHALLINCARGGIVNEAPLARALRDGVIGGAGVDVMAEEPPRSGGPLLELAEEGCHRLIVTPHVAWASEGSLDVLVEQLVGNLECWVQGRARNLVGVDGVEESGRGAGFVADGRGSVVDGEGAEIEL